MRYSHVHLDSTGYVLPPAVVTSESLEDRLATLYEKLRLRPGQLEALTGIRERRWWPRGHKPSEGAIAAARQALSKCDVPTQELGALIYGGVCRDNFEPATACAVAAAVGVSPTAQIYDISNACLGVMNGIVALADQIELGRIKAGMIVACESSREIIDIMIEEMLIEGSMEMFKLSLATLTGGSGAAALILTDGSFGTPGPRLLGGTRRAAPEHHALCRWGEDLRPEPRAKQYFETDAIPVLEHGVSLGKDTWADFVAELDWRDPAPEKVILHQVGAGNRELILKTLNLDPATEFPTFEFLGNMGTVSLPITAALAAERKFIVKGDRVGFLGIGSGLNCLMLGWEW